MEDQDDDKKTAIILFSFLFCVILMFIPWKEISLRRHENTCGFAYGKHTTKGNDYVEFRYKTKSKKWLTSSLPLDDISEKNLYALKKMKCIKIIYSKRFNSMIKVVDKRLKVK